MQRIPIDMNLHPAGIPATGGSVISATPPGAAACLQHYWDARNKATVYCILIPACSRLLKDREAAAICLLGKEEGSASGRWNGKTPKVSPGLPGEVSPSLNKANCRTGRLHPSLSRRSPKISVQN